MLIPNHISSSYIQNCFKSTSLNKSKSSKKLASGYRINTAADDAAKLSISEKMRAQIRGLDQASNNIQDSISLLQVADGALETVSAITQRIRELAVQAANDTYTDQDRDQMQQECDQLQEEMLSIFDQTSFHSKSIFTKPNLTSKEIARLFLEKKMPIFYSPQEIDGKTIPDDALNLISQSFRLAAISNDLEEKFLSSDKLTRDNCVITIINYQLEFIQYGKKLNGYGERPDYLAYLQNAEDKLTEALRQKETGGNWRTPYSEAEQFFIGLWSGSRDSFRDFADALVGLSYIITATHKTPESRAKYIYETIVPNLFDQLTNVAKANLAGTSLLQFLQQDPTPDYDSAFQILAELSGMKEISLSLQSGPNANQGMQLKVIIPNISKSPFDFSSHKGANATMDRADQFLAWISGARAEIGAYQNRLESALSYTAQGSEFLQDSESRMRDANMAKESADYLKTKLQNDFQLSFLAQKNTSGSDVSVLSFPKSK